MREINGLAPNRCPYLFTASDRATHAVSASLLRPDRESYIFMTSPHRAGGRRCYCAFMKAFTPACVVGSVACASSASCFCTYVPHYVPYYMPKLGFGLCGPSDVGDHSITWSARVNNCGGIVRPSAFAVLRLITSSNFVGCSTGKSAGLAPLRILFT
jgi:hypothetical protein